MHPAVTLLLALIMLAIQGAVFWQAADYARATHLEWDAGAARTCVVVHKYGPLTTRQSILVRNIAVVLVTSHRGKNSTSYGVSLGLRDGSSIALQRSGLRAGAESLRDRIKRLVDAAPAEATTIHTDDSSPFLALLLALVGLGSFAFTVYFLNGAARLVFDFDRGTLEYTRSHWPFTRTRRTFHARDVENARVATRMNSKGGTIYELALTVRGEGELVLVSGPNGGKARTTAAAAELNALLGKLHDETAERAA